MFAAVVVSTGACSGSDGSDASTESAPSTTAADGASTTAVVEPLTADEEAAAIAVVVEYHAVVAEVLGSLDGESEELAAITTPAYGDQLASLIANFASSGTTVEPDYRADVVGVSRVSERAVLVELCEVDATVLVASNGQRQEPTDTAPRASFIALESTESGEFLVAGGGLDTDTGRTCP